jgi:hypothetical protein
VLYCYHVVLYCSLLLRRGGMLLAIVVCGVSICILMPLLMLLLTDLGPLREDAAVGWLAVLFGACVVLLHWRTLKRLERAAAAE